MAIIMMMVEWRSVMMILMMVMKAMIMIPETGLLNEYDGLVVMIIMMIMLVKKR